MINTSLFSTESLDGRKLTELEASEEMKLFFKPKKQLLIAFGILIAGMTIAQQFIEFDPAVVFGAVIGAMFFFFGIYCGIVSERYRSSLPNQPVRDFFRMKMD